MLHEPSRGRAGSLTPKQDRCRVNSAHVHPEQPRGKSMVSSVNSLTNATRIGWHLWEIDLRFAPGLLPGWMTVEARQGTGRGGAVRVMQIHQSGIKSFFLVPRFVLELAGIRRRLVQIKAVKKDHLMAGGSRGRGGGGS